MDFNQRKRLLADDEEWLNIPAVLRCFLQQINEEGMNMRSMLDSLRREQKETNALLKITIEKQADAEIDTARNFVTLQSERRTSPEDIKRINEQIIHLRRRYEKLEERVDTLSRGHVDRAAVQKLQTDLEGVSADITHRFAATQSAVDFKIDACTSNAASLASSCAERDAATRAYVDTSLKSLQAALHDELEMAQTQCSKRATEANGSCAALQSAVADSQQATRALEESVAATKQATEESSRSSAERFASMLRTIKRLQSFCEAQQVRTSEDMNHHRREVINLLATHEEEHQRHASNLLDAFAELDANTLKTTRRLEQELERLHALLRGVRDEMQSELKAAAAVWEPTEGVRDCSRRLERLESEIRDLNRQVESLAASGPEGQHQHAEELLRQEGLNFNFNERLDRVERCVKEARTDNTASVDLLRKEVSQLISSVRDGNLLREEADRRVTRLCEVVNKLSAAVSELEVPPNEPKPALSSTPSVQDELKAQVNALRAEIMCCVQEQHGSQRSSTQSLQAEMNSAAERLAETERALAALTQTVRANASESKEQLSALLSEVPLREIVPALIDLQSVSRRLAFVESRCTSDEVKDAGQRAQERHAAWRDAALADNVLQELQRRFFEVSQHVLALEQRLAIVTREVQITQSRTNETDRVAEQLDAKVQHNAEEQLRVADSVVEHRAATRDQLAQLQQSLSELTEKYHQLASKPPPPVAVQPREMVDEAAQVAERLARLEARVSGAADQQEDVKAAVATAHAESSAQWSRVLQQLEGRLDEQQRRCNEHTARLDELLIQMRERWATALAGQPEPEKRAPSCDLKAVELYLQEWWPRHGGAALAEVEHKMTLLEADMTSALRDVQSAAAPPSNPLEDRLSEARGSLARLSESYHALSLAVAAQHEELQQLRTLHEENTREVQSAKSLSAQDVEQMTQAVATTWTVHLNEVEAAVRAMPDWHPAHEAMRDDLTSIEKKLEVLSAQMDDALENNAKSATLSEAAMTAAENKNNHALHQLREQIEARLDGLPSKDAVESVASAQTALRDLEQGLRAVCYPKAELEERLENLWMSVVSLLARKCDQELVDEKFDGLHQLMSKEVQIEMRRLDSELHNALAEKVSLTELQQLLEDNIDEAA